MFAIIKDKSVIGFITDESQKAFLIENEPSVSFIEFEWAGDNTDPDNFLMSSDIHINDDGTVTVQKATDVH